MVTHNLRFRRLVAKYVVCRFPADSTIPSWATISAHFSSITRTDEELSLVCLMENVPEEFREKIQWTCFKLEGPFSFAAVGVLHSFIAPLAQAGIPIFSVSTYDTDYVLVNDVDAARAIETLQSAGHDLIS